VTSISWSKTLTKRTERKYASGSNQVLARDSIGLVSLICYGCNDNDDNDDGDDDDDLD